MTTENVYDLCYELFGACGAMLSGSKRAPEEQRVVWNGNVLVGRTKVWYGDISIRDKAAELQRLANETGQVVSVLREMDARFGSEKTPDLRVAVEQFTPEGS